jgi:hypothetical protein
MDDELIQEAVLDRKQGGGDPGADADLVIDVFQMVSNGVFAQEQLCGHLSPAEPSGQQAEELDLAAGKAARPLALA